MKRLTRKKKWLFTALVLIIIAIIGGYFLFKSQSPTPTASPTVVLSPVTEQNVPLTISGLGNLLAPESTTLQNQQAGVVNKIYFTNGQTVQKGTLLMQLDDTAQRAQYNKDQAALVETKLMYDRYQQLNHVDASVLSRVEMDQVYANYQEAKATLEGDAKTLSDMQIRAPFTGTLGATTLSVGSYLSVGDSIVPIVNNNDLEVVYPVPESDFGLVNLGQKVSLTSDAYANKTFSGTVVFKAPLVDETSGSFNVRARVDTPAGLSPGMLVHLTQTLVPNRMVLAVPTSALVSEASGFAVYQVQNGKVVETYVQIGSQFGNYTEITSGLATGDEIIVQGNEKVQAGMSVQVVSAS